MDKEREIKCITLYRKRRKEINERLKNLGKKKYALLGDYIFYDDIMTEEEFKIIKRKLRNKLQQRYRCNQKFRAINYVQEYKPFLVFGTLTFDDSQFYKKNGKEIQERTRTKKVNNWLIKNTLYSIANIDYGEKNEREHHHFVAILPSNTILNFTGHYSRKGYPLYTIEGIEWEGGWYTIEIIEYDVEDHKNKRISNYMLKLINHENKRTTKNRRFRIFDNIELSKMTLK